MLFLQESVVTKTAPISFMEAQAGLLETTMQMSALNEAAMQADFSIHSSLNEGVLTENGAEEKKGNLFSNFAKRVRDLLVRAKDFIVRFFRTVVERLKALWARLTGRNAMIAVPKGAVAVINKMHDEFANVLKIVQSRAKDAMEYKSKVEGAMAKWESVKFSNLKAFQQMVNKGEVEEVKVTQLNKIQVAANTALAISKTATKELDKGIKEAEKAASDKEPTEQAKEGLAMAQAQTAAFGRLVGVASTFSVMVNNVIRGNYEGSKKKVNNNPDVVADSLEGEWLPAEKQASGSAAGLLGRDDFVIEGEFETVDSSGPTQPRLGGPSSNRYPATR